MFQLNKWGKVGIFLGVLGGVGGMAAAFIASLSEGDTGGAIAVVVMGTIFIAIFGGVFMAIFKPMMDQARILKEGNPGTATILELSDTGVTVNDNPQIKLLLEVKPAGGAPYKAETKIIVSRLQTSVYQPGQTLQVMIDKTDKTKVAIAGVGSSAMPYMNEEEAKRMLEEVDAKNREILLNGVSATAIVMSYKELGIQVNGMNPAVELELQVIPSDIKPFKATVRGVVIQSAIAQFQPGEEIFVKYDPNNTSQVTIEHS